MKIYFSLLPHLNIVKILSFSFLAFYSLVSNAQSMMSEGYQLSKISPEPYTQVIQRSGKVNFKHIVNLSFKSSGFLTQLNFDEGEHFTNKQQLAALDTEELIADKNASYARLLQAKRNVSRIKTLMEKSLSSQRELDDALTAVETTRAVYRVAFYSLKKAQISAPFDGVVITRNSELGELQSPNKAVLQVAALKNNHIVSVAITGKEMSLVHLNQHVKVHLPYYGIIEGVISKIPAISDSHSHLFTIEVLLSVDDVTRPLVVGQLAQIIIYAKTSDYVYRLPIEALNGVDKYGQALIAIEENNVPAQRAFEIHTIDTEFLYLQAHQNLPALAVITQGWNKLSLETKEQ